MRVLPKKDSWRRLMGLASRFTHLKFDSQLKGSVTVGVVQGLLVECRRRLPGWSNGCGVRPAMLGYGECNLRAVSTQTSTLPCAYSRSAPAGIHGC